jgi:hypothetical protein
MQSQKRNEGPQGNHHEKWPAGYPGGVSDLRYQNVQDWQEQIRTPISIFQDARGGPNGIRVYVHVWRGEMFRILPRHAGRLRIMHFARCFFKMDFSGIRAEPGPDSDHGSHTRLIKSSRFASLK